MYFKRNNYLDRFWDEITNIVETDDKRILYIQYVDYRTKMNDIFVYYPNDTETMFFSTDGEILRNNKTVYREFLTEKEFKKVGLCSSITECKKKSFFDLKEIMEILDSDKPAKHKLDDLKDYFTN